jgi:hypothetical protein
MEAAKAIMQRSPAPPTEESAASARRAATLPQTNHHRRYRKPSIAPPPREQPNMPITKWTVIPDFRPKLNTHRMGAQEYLFHTYRQKCS